MVAGVSQASYVPVIKGTTSYDAPEEVMQGGGRGSDVVATAILYDVLTPTALNCRDPLDRADGRADARGAKVLGLGPQVDARRPRPVAADAARLL